MITPHTNKWLVVGIVILTASTAQADIQPAQVFSDHMVLQRKMLVPVWGWADPGEFVQVSFAGQVLETKAGADGRWMVRLQPMEATNEGQVLTIGTNKIRDVVVGEVWICSGQSNMQFALAKVLNGDREVAEADYPAIRRLNMERTAAYLPRTDAQSEWSVCTPEVAGGYTAVGYFFGRKLHLELNIPIGLIDASWGGTGVEPWISQAGYVMVPELKEIWKKVAAGLPISDEGQDVWEDYLAELEAWLPGARKQVEANTLPVNIPKRPSKLVATHHAPTKIFNAVINPLVPYAIRGTIWYQGESNGGEGISYFYKKKALIEGWRKIWGQGAFPFYLVQLANLHPYNPKPEGGEGYSRIREAQRKCLELENTGMAVTCDIGNPTDIHPKNKQDVGERLALWALAKDYERHDLVYSGPLYERIEIKGREAHIHFSSTGSGLMTGDKDGLQPTRQVDGPLKGFAIAGSDEAWHWADARIGPRGKTVILTSEKVPVPVAARYAYRWNPIESNLYNKEKLPAAPFRSDSW